MFAADVGHDGTNGVRIFFPSRVVSLTTHVNSVYRASDVVTKHDLCGYGYGRMNEQAVCASTDVDLQVDYEGDIDLPCRWRWQCQQRWQRRCRWNCQRDVNSDVKDCECRCHKQNRCK